MAAFRVGPPDGDLVATAMPFGFRAQMLTFSLGVEIRAWYGVTECHSVGSWFPHTELPHTVRQTTWNTYYEETN